MRSSKNVQPVKSGLGEQTHFLDDGFRLRKLDYPYYGISSYPIPVSGRHKKLASSQSLLHKPNPQMSRKSQLQMLNYLCSCMNEEHGTHSRVGVSLRPGLLTFSVQ